MRLLITGSRGLVGATLLETLRRAGIEAVEFDIRKDRRDIRNPVAVRQAMAGCDGVVHLAAISRVACGEADPALCDDINITGTAVILDAALGAAHRPWVLFASSREIYGDPDVFPVREDAPMAPVNAYGRSKAEGEKLVAAAAAEGLRTAIIRFSNVYGTGNDHPDRAVPSLLWRAVQGKELQISGENHFFDFVHVEDCARGLMTVIDRLQAGRDTPPLHLATGIRTTLDELARAARAVAQSASPLKILPSRSFDVAGFQGDPARAAEVLGWHARIGLEEGLRRLRDIMVQRARPLDPVEMPLAMSDNPAD